MESPSAVRESAKEFRSDSPVAAALDAMAMRRLRTAWQRAVPEMTISAFATRRASVPASESRPFRWGVPSTWLRCEREFANPVRARNFCPCGRCDRESDRGSLDLRRCLRVRRSTRVPRCSAALSARSGHEEESFGRREAAAVRRKCRRIHTRHRCRQPTRRRCGVGRAFRRVRRLDRRQSAGLSIAFE